MGHRHDDWVNRTTLSDQVLPKVSVVVREPTVLRTVAVTLAVRYTSRLCASVEIKPRRRKTLDMVGAMACRHEAPHSASFFRTPRSHLVFLPLRAGVWD